MVNSAGSVLMGSFINRIDGFMRQRRKRQFAFSAKYLVLALLCFAPWPVWAACSQYMGLVTINEASKEQQNNDSADDFVEVKLLDSSIPASVYSSWNLQICDADDDCNTVSLGDADASGLPWLVISDVEAGANMVSRYLDFTVGTDILLTDANGDAIDYLTADGFNISQPSCDFVYDTTADTGNNTRRVQRDPDGTGDWFEPPGNSHDSTDSTTNDGDVPADAPELSIDDVSVAAGGDLVFTLTLNASYDQDVNVDYVTVNGTAEAGTDYSPISGVASITAGTTTTQLTVSSFLAGVGSFYLSLSNADNAVITDQVGKGVIISSPLAEWRFDEFGWNGSPGEVEDSSGSGLHGMAVNDASTSDATPALSGSPGTCFYGDFDGIDDYVMVGSSSLLDLTSELTITAWVKPASGGSGVNTILSKGDVDSHSYILRLTAANTLEFVWCSAHSGNCDSSQSLSSAGSLPLDQWSHVAVSFAQGTQHLYINGSRDGSGTSSAAINPNGSSLYLASSGSAGGGFSGAVDELRIYEQAFDALLIDAIMDETRTCAAPTLDHYHISFDGGATASDSTAITCEAASVTITAHPAGHVGTVIPGAGTSISLSTSSNQGYWSSADVGSVVDGGGGDASYMFVGGHPSVSLQFNHTIPAVAPAAVNINIAGAGGEHPDEDPNIEFFEAGFRFVDGAEVADISNQIAAQDSANYFLQAIRMDNDTGQCVGVFADGQRVDVDLAAECNDPTTCAGMGLTVTNDGTSHTLATTDDDNVAGAAAYSTTSLLFGADSKASFSFNYPDVGSLSLHARHQLANDDGSLSSDYMLGSSLAFVVRPASFVITEISAAGTPNPGTSDAAPGFVAAGDPFRVVVQARNALGNNTPNYGNEEVEEGISFNFSTLQFPSGGNPGLLNNPGAFSATTTAGEFDNTTLSWNEVGSFTAYASVADGDYLGAGNVVSADSGTIGRFYPKAFYLDTAASGVSNSCISGAFSYMSEPDVTVDYRIEARNSGGGKVSNYDDTNLNYPVTTVSIHGEADNDGSDLAARLSVISGIWSEGEMLVNDSLASVARAGSPDGPLTNLAVGLRVADLDGADFADLDFNPDSGGDCAVAGDCDAKLLGMLEARFGRLYLQDGHGPESAAIPMVWRTEYWNGSRFVLNSDDQCTLLPLTAVEFMGATSAVDEAADSIDVSVGGVTSTFDFSDPNGASDCLSSTAIGFCDGSAGLAYGAPGSTVTYPISIDLSGLPWLQGDWNQDGFYDDTPFPQVNIRFQHYRGHDRVIYWREVFE